MVDFKDFYYNQKNKKVYEVIRESSTQEITAIYDEDTKGFSIRIQRFSKMTGAPHNQSFSFHGGALSKFLRFLESIDLLEFPTKGGTQFTEEHINDLIERKKVLNEVLNNSNSLPPEFIYAFFNALNKKQKSNLLKNFIINIDSYDAESLDAAIKHLQSISARNACMLYMGPKSFSQSSEVTILGE